MKDVFCYRKFKEINLSDSFFDSLKRDYKEFQSWFMRKSEEYAYIQEVDGKIEGFLYLKAEDGPVVDIEPIIADDKVIKIGTMKINPHGTRLGERFIKKAVDLAISRNINTIYVTAFEKHEALINLYKRYGFIEHGTKNTLNGIELVFTKKFNYINNDVLLDYPLVNLKNRKYLLGIYPEFHTTLFPDSILNNESFDIVEDVSHTNSIEKIYICKMPPAAALKKGDVLLIYRTSDRKGQAKYRSVATSVCVVEDVKSVRNFSSFNNFKDYCKNYSVFSDSDLEHMFYSKKIYYIIKMTYNIAFRKRIIQKRLIEEAGFESSYWGFFQLSTEQFKKAIEMGEVNESYIID